MKIIQTFWSSGRNPLEHSFGWPHAEYNLMSWTLSCLSLREHFDQVELYTDKRGYEVLIEKLHLPYTQVHVIYDDNLCLPQHWAYAKIKTYSLQNEPFLHIDGDMYFPKPIPQEILDAGLVAQNREIGTSYYQGMMNRVLAHPEFKLPQFIQETLDNGTMASYNMGIFGGNDIDFIHRYCQEVFAFFEANHMNDASVEYSNEECNVFFEQIFLAAMVDKEKKEVATLISKPFEDNGYTKKDFCDLRRYSQKEFFHLLGGHKKTQNITKALAKALLRISPVVYENIVGLFLHEENFMYFANKTDHGISHYRNYIWSKLKSWHLNDNINRIKAEEKEAAKYDKFVFLENNAKLSAYISKPKYIAIYTIPEDWNDNDRKIIRAKLNVPNTLPMQYIGIVPLSHKGLFDEIALTQMEKEILEIHCWTGAPQPVVRIVQKIIENYKTNLTNAVLLNRLQQHILNEITRLVEHGMLLAGNNPNSLT